MRARSALIAASSLLAALIAPAAATAGTVSIDGTVLRYSDTSGQADDVAVRRDFADGDVIRVSRNGGTPISESEAACTLNGDVVTCTGANAMTRVVVSTGGGDDSVDFSDLGFAGEAQLGPGADAASVVDQDRPFVVVLDGGDGPDNLIGGNGNDRLDGGGDSDYLQGRGGADDIGGGAGFDFLDYYAEPGRTGRVVVSLDGVDNDGNPAANEKDDVGTDVEDVTGTRGDDVLTGSDAGNALYGFEGNDQIDGGGGVDVLDGGFGNDSLKARDGIAERVDCSRGTDSAIVDDNDSTNSCETLDSSPDLIPDRDGDGISKPADCNDASDAIKPGAFDVPDDGIDQNCDGVDAVNLDRDRDGANRPQDCDDTNAARHPGATDVPANGIDEDCAGGDAQLPSFRPAISANVARAGRGTRFTKITLATRRGDAVVLSCPTRRCSVRQRVLDVRRTGALQLGRFVKATLTRGTVLRIVVSRDGFRDAVIRLTVRRPGGAPRLSYE